jgi:LmbE family N-acetylglucosaminyl deacetylase
MLQLSLPPGDLDVLCLGAHPDDIEIGCGGTLLELMSGQRRAMVAHVVMTGTPERQDEACHGARLFDDAETIFGGLQDGRLPEAWGATKQLLEDVARARAVPDLLFAPRVDDAHQDHRLLGELATTTWRDSLVLHYDIPKWDGDLGRATTYVQLSAETAQQKIGLLNEAYPSQKSHDWWDDELFASVMRLRGMECRARYAEAFVVTKSRLNLGVLT